MFRAAIVILSVFFICANCKSFLKKQAIGTMVSMMNESRATFEQEESLELAEISLSSNLKLLEALWFHDKGNEELNLFLAEGFAQYALAFIEDKKDEFEESDDELSEYYRVQAVKMYRRSLRYSARILLPKLNVSSSHELSKLHHNEFAKRVSKLSKDDLKAAFWYAFALGSSINLNRAEIAGLGDLYQVEFLLNRVKEIDGSYYFGAAYMFIGLYHGSRTKTLGGNARLAQDNFAKAFAITQNKFLMIHYFYAKTYCISQQDILCFDKSLNYVLNSSENIYPEQRMANLLAKKKARRLLEQKENLFVDYSAD